MSRILTIRREPAMAGLVASLPSTLRPVSGGMADLGVIAGGAGWELNAEQLSADGVRTILVADPVITNPNAVRVLNKQLENDGTTLVPVRRWADSAVVDELSRELETLYASGTGPLLIDIAATAPAIAGGVRWALSEVIAVLRHATGAHASATASAVAPGAVALDGWSNGIPLTISSATVDIDEPRLTLRMFAPSFAVRLRQAGFDGRPATLEVDGATDSRMWTGSWSPTLRVALARAAHLLARGENPRDAVKSNLGELLDDAEFPYKDRD